MYASTLSLLLSSLFSTPFAPTATVPMVCGLVGLRNDTLISFTWAMSSTKAQLPSHYVQVTTRKIYQSVRPSSTHTGEMRMQSVASSSITDLSISIPRNMLSVRRYELTWRSAIRDGSVTTDNTQSYWYYDIGCALPSFAETSISTTTTTAALQTIRQTTAQTQVQTQTITSTSVPPAVTQTLIRIVT
jgi:hypothetical protein